MRKQKQAGFTVVELMIATTVFSVVLLMIAGAVVEIGRLYMKGLNMSRTQEVARNITDEISRTIQYSKGPVFHNLSNGSARGHCAANYRYTYYPNVQVTSAGGNQGVKFDTSSVPCSLTTASMSTPRQVLSDKMRINKLEITPRGPEAYLITVRVIYGDDDLLCQEGTPGCSDNSVLSITPGMTLKCKDVKTSSQFCAVSELSTIVERRL